MARRWNTDGTLNQSWPDEPSDDDDDDGQGSRYLVVQVKIDMHDTDPDEYQQVAGEVGCRVLAALWGRHA
jgi:hypothetical protein